MQVAPFIGTGTGPSGAVPARVVLWSSSPSSARVRPDAFLSTQAAPVTARTAADSSGSSASAQAALGWITAISPKRSITTPGRPSASAWTSR